MTQNQLHELLESEGARSLVEGAEERGFIEPAELEAFALEHELNEDEIEQLSRELEANGLEIGQPQAAAETRTPEPPPQPTDARLLEPPRRRLFNRGSGGVSPNGT